MKKEHEVHKPAWVNRDSTARDNFSLDSFCFLRDIGMGAVIDIVLRCQGHGWDKKLFINKINYYDFFQCVHTFNIIYYI